MPPRKKKQEEVAVEETPAEESKQIIQEVSINDLFECLKEFDNKVLIERLKVLERTVSLLHKEQVATKAMLKEMQQALVNLNLTYEELLHNLGLTLEESTEEEMEASITKENEVVAIDQVKAGKKWN